MTTTTPPKPQASAATSPQGAAAATPDPTKDPVKPAPIPTTAARIARAKDRYRHAAQAYEAMLTRVGAGETNLFDELSKLHEARDQIEQEICVLSDVALREEKITADVRRVVSSKANVTRRKTVHRNVVALLAKKRQLYSECLELFLQALQKHRDMIRAEHGARLELREDGGRQVWDGFAIRLGKPLNTLPLVMKLAASGGVAVDRLDLPCEDWRKGAQAVRDKILRDVDYNHANAVELLGFLLEDTELETSPPEAA